jgi:hypothetical protein
MRRPIVRTMAHPPTTVPAVSTRPVAPRAGGTVNGTVRPGATSGGNDAGGLSASFEPLAKAIDAEVAHSRRIGRSTRRWPGAKLNRRRSIRDPTPKPAPGRS